MDNLIYFVFGITLGLLLKNKPLKFVIHHKNENIIPTMPDVNIPKMSDIARQNDVEEDKAYEEMGKVMDNVQEIFGGSDRS